MKHRLKFNTLQLERMQSFAETGKCSYNVGFGGLCSVCPVSFASTMNCGYSWSGDFCSTEKVQMILNDYMKYIETLIVDGDAHDE